MIVETTIEGEVLPALEAEQIYASEVARGRDAALAVKKSNGQRVGTVPFGHDLASDGVTLVSNEMEQGIIKEISKMRAAGETLKAIAQKLTDRGVPTKSGNRKWGHTSVRAIIMRAS